MLVHSIIIKSKRIKLNINKAKRIKQTINKRMSLYQIYQMIKYHRRIILFQRWRGGIIKSDNLEAKNE